MVVVYNKPGGDESTEEAHTALFRYEAIKTLLAQPVAFEFVQTSTRPPLAVVLAVLFSRTPFALVFTCVVIVTTVYNGVMFKAEAVAILKISSELGYWQEVTVLIAPPEPRCKLVKV